MVLGMNRYYRLADPLTGISSIKGSPLEHLPIPYCLYIYKKYSRYNHYKRTKNTIVGIWKTGFLSM